MRPQLIFVYNADSGLFNTVTDIAHKLLSPSTYSCNLCALTHGAFKIREDWVAFLDTLDADLEFLHRDEFRKAHPEMDVALPALFGRSSEGLECWIDAETLRSFASLDALRNALVLRLVQRF